MDTTTELHNLSVTTEANLPCLAQKNWFAIGFMPLDSLAILLNFTLLVASMLDKQKLQRQNYTLACVNSALLSHIVYLSLKLWGASANIMAEDSPLVPGLPKVVWTVCEAGMASIGFGVVANASSVIFVTLDSTIVTSRSTVRTNYATHSSAKSRLPFKRKIAVLLISVSWIVPVTFITIATLTWNCSADCWCPSSSYAGEVCPHEYRCSRVITPLPTLFLLVNAALWTFEMTALVIMIGKKYRQFQNSASPQPDVSTAASDVSIPETVERTELKEYAKKNVHVPANKSRTENHYTRRVRLNPRFQMAVIFTAFLFVWFLPMGLTIIIDAAKPDANLMPAMIISTLCMYAYMVAFPVLLLKYLPSLRTSLSQMFQKVVRPCGCRD